MKDMTFRLAALVVLAGVLAAFPSHEAMAHRVNLFAYVDGGKIVTESWFSKSSRVRQGAIEVFDAATGEKYLSGTTDDEGKFVFDVPPAARDKKADLRIEMRAGEGHGNETVVKASEYLNAPITPGPTSATPAPAAATGTPTPAVQAAAPAPAPVAAAPSTATADPVLLGAMDKLLDAKLAPVKTLLAEAMDPAPSMTEILGGIGWIFGLVGIAAYFKSRKG